MNPVVSLAKRLSAFFVILICALHLQSSAQPAAAFIYGDALPDAPVLAARGEYPVGVRTMEWVNNNQINILKAKDGIDYYLPKIGRAHV